MKHYYSFDEAVAGDIFDRNVVPLRKAMVRKHLKSFSYGNLKVVLTRYAGLAFTNGNGEVLFRNDSTAIMDETMADTSVGQIEADLYTLQKQICA